RPAAEDYFKRLDTNGDGKLSKDEYAVLVKQSAKLRDNPQQAEAYFKLLDKDGDGSLSLEEFRRISSPGAKAQAAKNPTSPVYTREQLEVSFKMLDTDQDGKLDRKEFSHIGDTSAKMRNDPDQVDYLFRLLDQ